MYNFREFLQDLSLNTGLKFDLILDDGTYIYEGLKNAENIETYNIFISLGNSKGSLRLPKNLESCSSLLKYTIQNKYNEFYSMKEQSIIEIIEGKDISINYIEKDFPFLLNGAALFIIDVDGSKLEALNIIRQLYNEKEAISFIYKNRIIILGLFDEVNEHAESIRQSIVSDLYCKCTISYGNLIYDIKDIKRAYEQALECFTLRKTFKIKDEIFFYDKVLFEKIVLNINKEIKDELLLKLKDKFDLFDKEIIDTIDEFVNSGLNISDAARKLYIHRNTLIYRLDKINKETGFDIRNFKEATVFVIAFLIWKEKKQ